MTITPSNYDVVIIGHGPVGSTLANILGQYNISTLILDQEESAYHLPRAVAFDDEIMRIFQSLDLSDQMENIAEVGGNAHEKRSCSLINPIIFYRICIFIFAWCLILRGGAPGCARSPRRGSANSTACPPPCRTAGQSVASPGPGTSVPR